MKEEERGTEMAALDALSNQLQQCVELSSALPVFPPPERQDEEWQYLGGAVDHVFGAAHGGPTAELVGAWENLERSKDDRAAFQVQLDTLLGRLSGIAEQRGEYSKVPLEVSFYRAKFFTRALAVFLLSFVLVAISWLAPRSRWLVAAIWGTAGLGVVLVVAGVVVRCIIRGRPPVSTLYETILFITGCVTLVCLVIEWIQRGRIGLALAPVLGAAGMFLAMKYELKEAATSGDTMPSLVAVLDTNFWLATHVTTITLGYAAGLLAAALGNLWLVGKMIGLKRGDATFYRSIARMAYGVICFGLFFSVVGTILGGVWANYSWGRFWGWDPKENGALLICLGALFILHARMGGYVRDHGLCALAALNGMSVAFSWWHVNNLGVGLHSYGKTEGVLLALYTYYGIALAIVVGSLIWRSASAAAAAPEVVRGEPTVAPRRVRNASTMQSTATRILDGKATAKAVRTEVAERVRELRAAGVVPGLTVVLVGDDPASEVYVRNKDRAAAEAGFAVKTLKLSASTAQAELERIVDQLNADRAVHGILVQLPLPAGLRSDPVLQRLDPAKDVDGLHPANVAALWTGAPGLVPCTPAGCIEILDRHGIEIAGRRAVVIGRSILVGKPLAGCCSRGTRP
jgi:ABC-type transport system involved in cytochrome c biogenesis permease subunit